MIIADDGADLPYYVDDEDGYNYQIELEQQGEEHAEREHATHARPVTYCGACNPCVSTNDEDPF